MREFNAGDRPPAHPVFDLGPSEYVTSATGSPSLLTDRERSLLAWLAIQNLCRQFGCDEQTAADALDHFAAEGRSHIRGDQRDVFLVVDEDKVIVHAARDWLRAMAEGNRN
jgi:hypothetical protein